MPDGPLPGRRSRLRRVLGLVSGLLILVFLGLEVASSWDRVRDFHWQLDPVGAMCGVAAILAMYAASAGGYVLILEQLSERRLPRRRFVAIWGRSLLGRYVPGNVLMVASRLVLGREAGVARRVSFAASVYEQALSLATCALGGLALIVTYGGDGLGAAAALIAAVPLGLVLLHPGLFGPLSSAILRRLGREPLAALLSARQLVLLVAWYGGTSALLAAGIGLVVRSTAGAESGSVVYIGLAFLLSYVISMLAFVFPSGLGVREGVFALALGRNLAGGVAIAISAGTRLVLTGAELLFVGMAVLADQMGRRADARRPK